MNDTLTPPADRLAAALSATSGSDRLRAAMTAGTRPDPGFVEPLVARCAVEPDFAVREMLTWALIQLPRDVVLPSVTAELLSNATQAQSQALHTLSKLGDERAWPAITQQLLSSEHDEVAGPLETAEFAAVAAARAPAIIHAQATARLLADPEASFALEPIDARRLGTAFSGGRGAY